MLQANFSQGSRQSTGRTTASFSSEKDCQGRDNGRAVVPLPSLEQDAVYQEAG